MFSPYETAKIYKKFSVSENILIDETNLSEVYLRGQSFTVEKRKRKAKSHLLQKVHCG